MVDPDGQLIGDPPIEVTCIFGAGDGAITEIDNLNKDIIVADHCEGIQCFSEEINYPVSKNQMLALKSISTSCTQEISFGCFLAPIVDEEQLFGGWLDVNGMFHLNRYAAWTDG